jgi:hypothetical protein
MFALKIQELRNTCVNFLDSNNVVERNSNSMSSQSK